MDKDSHQSNNVQNSHIISVKDKTEIQKSLNELARILYEYQKVLKKDV